MAVLAPEPETRGASGSLFLATLERLGALGDGFLLPVGPRATGWLPADVLSAGGPELDDTIDTLVRAAGAERQRAIGSQLLERYLRFVWPAAAAFALERRVPDVGAANLLVRLEDGWPVGFALAEPRFAALADDPAAGEAAWLAGDRDALMAWLWERAIDANVGPVIATIQRRLGTSPTALWGNVAAAFVHPLLWRAQLVSDDPPSVLRDAEALLGTPAAAGLRDRVLLHRVDCEGDEWTVSSRRSCCLRWSLPEGANCAGCPLVRSREPRDGLRERLADAVAGTAPLRRTFVPT